MSTIEQNSIVGGPCLLLLPKKRVCQGRQVLHESALFVPDIRQKKAGNILGVTDADRPFPNVSAFVQ